jgi:hypothetical protein
MNTLAYLSSLSVTKKNMLYLPLTLKTSKLKCLSLTSLSGIIYCLRVMAGAYPRGEHLKVVTLSYALSLHSNIGLGWKGFPGINTLAYLANL